MGQRALQAKEMSADLNEDSWTDLHEAAAEGEYDKVLQLLKENPELAKAENELGMNAEDVALSGKQYRQAYKEAYTHFINNNPELSRSENGSENNDHRGDISLIFRNLYLSSRANQKQKNKRAGVFTTMFGSARARELDRADNNTVDLENTPDLPRYTSIESASSEDDDNLTFSQSP